MEVYLFTSALRDFLRLRRLVPWVLLGFAGMLLAIAWPYLNTRASAIDQYTSISSILVFHVLALASAIFSTAIVGQEVEQRTIVYLLTRPVSRWKLVIARYLAASTVVALLGILGAVLVSTGVYHLGGLSNPLLKNDVCALVAGAFSYGALFLLASLLINRAMIVCLLFAFGWETIVPNMPGEMYRLSVYSHLMAIADHPSSETTGGAVDAAAGVLSTNIISPATAYMTLIVMSGVLIVMSAAWFSRSEIVPREDAE